MSSTRKQLFLGQQRNAIFTPMAAAPPGYAAAERRLHPEAKTLAPHLNIRSGERV